MTTFPPSNHQTHANCAADDVIKWGTTSDGNQRYRCKSTGATWTDNGAEPGRRVPAEHVGVALSLFFDGLSLRDVQRNFGPIFESQPASSTVYEWIRDYSDLAQVELKPTKPTRLGNTWVVDEMVVKAGGQNVWIWTVMDAKTRFVLAQRVTRDRGIHHAGALFRDSLRASSGALPDKVYSDGLPAYPRAIREVLGKNVRHVVTGSVAGNPDNNMVERLNGTIRERTKVMRGWKSRVTGLELLEGWRIHYNYFRPHESLNGRTPAEVAGVKTEIKNWEDVAKRDVRPVSRIRQFRELERRGRAEPEGDLTGVQLEMGPILRKRSALREQVKATGVHVKKRVGVRRDLSRQRDYTTHKAESLERRKRGFEGMPKKGAGFDLPKRSGFGPRKRRGFSKSRLTGGPDGPTGLVK